jgi:hypothetical protein
MTTINFILYLLAAICFLVAFIGLVTSRFNILALGLLCWVLVPLIAAGRAL